MKSRFFKFLSWFLFSALFLFEIQASQAAEVKLPAYEKYSLENGLVVYLVPMKKLPLVNFRLVVPAGSVYDPKTKEGLAGLTATLLKKGTKNKTATQISEEIEFVGGSLSTGTIQDLAYITAEFLSKDTDLGLNMISDILFNPIFPQEEIERERSQVLAGLEQEKDEPTVVANKHFYEFLFGDHPYAHAVEGNSSSVQSLSRKDILDFYQKYYKAKGSVLVVVGDFDSSILKEKINKLFSAWEAGPGYKMKLPRPAKISGWKTMLVEKPDVTQTQIRIGNIGVARDNPDIFAINVTNIILGGGFASRLVDEIRVNRGLTYGVSSRFVPFKDSGIYLISTFTKNKTTRETIDVALAEVKKFREKGVSAEELKGAQNYIKGLFPLRLETPEAIATQITDIEFYGLDPNYVENYYKKIDAVTLDEVKKTAQKYFEYDNLAFLVVTNPKEVKSQLAGMGKLEVTKP